MGLPNALHRPPKSSANSTQGIARGLLTDHNLGNRGKENRDSSANGVGTRDATPLQDGKKVGREKEHRDTAQLGTSMTPLPPSWQK